MMRSGTTLTVLDLDGRRGGMCGSGRRWKSRPVSVLRSFKHRGLGPQIRWGRPAGQCPRSRMRRRYVVRVVVGPRRGIDARRVRQREAEEAFDLRERQDQRVRVSMLQVLIQRLIFAQHHGSFRSNGWRLVRPAPLDCCPQCFGHPSARWSSERGSRGRGAAPLISTSSPPTVGPRSRSLEPLPVVAPEPPTRSARLHSLCFGGRVGGRA
jgi:hypothetical protein